MNRSHKVAQLRGNMQVMYCVIRLSCIGETAVQSHTNGKKQKQKVEDIQIKKCFDPKITNQANEKPLNSNPSETSSYIFCNVTFLIFQTIKKDANN